ncbi:hypothetical protein D3C74_189300 [compost metagenome]
MIIRIERYHWLAQTDRRLIISCRRNESIIYVSQHVSNVVLGHRRWGNIQIAYDISDIYNAVFSSIHNIHNKRLDTRALLIEYIQIKKCTTLLQRFNAQGVICFGRDFNDVVFIFSTYVIMILVKLEVYFLIGGQSYTRHRLRIWRCSHNLTKLRHLGC